MARPSFLQGLSHLKGLSQLEGLSQPVRLNAIHPQRSMPGHPPQALARCPRLLAMHPELVAKGQPQSARRDCRAALRLALQQKAADHCLSSRVSSWMGLSLSTMKKKCWLRNWRFRWHRRRSNAGDVDSRTFAYDITQTRIETRMRASQCFSSFKPKRALTFATLADQRELSLVTCAASWFLASADVAVAAQSPAAEVNQ